jgi:hypothetical protein
MKYFITILFLIASLVGKSQSSLLVNGKLPLDSLYENKDEYLIISKVLEFEGLKKDELKTKVKNWGAIKFVNLKEVLVSETDDQIVLNYIESSFFITMGKKRFKSDFYIRLVIQFKDGKIRCQYIEDGTNDKIAFWIPPYDVRPTERGTYHLKQFFEEENGIMYSKKMITLGLLSFKENIISNLNSLKESILKKDTSKEW